MPNGIPKRKVTRAVAKTEVEVSGSALFHAWTQSPGKALQLIMRDRRYWALPMETWQLFLDYSDVDADTYRKERYDCDDFAQALSAEASRKFGVNSVIEVCDVSSGHAYCALPVVETNGVRIVFLEPQNDRWGVSGGQSYQLQNGFALV